MSINLRDLGFLHDNQQIHTNASKAVLIENSVRFHDCKLTPDGSVVMYSGKHTGRSPKDKYVVLSPKTEKTIDWSNNVHKMTAENFAAIKKEIIQQINKSNHLYVQLRNVGAVESHSLAVELYTPCASHALFFDHLMRSDHFNSEKKGYGTYRIFHAPTLFVETKKYGTRSETVVGINIDTKEIIIAGTLYAGEIKKAVFSVMNYILPEHSLLPMHSGANRGSAGDVSVFFGLSGTGKTTLSTQEGRLIIGDDEHGLSQDGVFNFEGGCYAKMYKISAESEPLIYKAANRFGSFLENVVLDKDNQPQYDDKSIAENTRSSYPLNYLDNVAQDSQGKIPNHIFFLSADAFGVLPPVSKLTRSQAMYYFLSGYTAKLAGTEIGVQEPSATFSTCFGAPFMMRAAQEYADLLGQFIDKYKINVWLINTGWTGGACGVGKRFPLAVTRRIIDAIQKDELKNAEFAAEDIFGLYIPKNIKDVQPELLFPRNTWSDGDAYKQTALKLVKMFHDNFKKFPQSSPEVQKGGPIANG